MVEACNLDGRQERLENMLAQLEMCEKALQVRTCSFCLRSCFVPLCTSPTQPWQAYVVHHELHLKNKGLHTTLLKRSLFSWPAGLPGDQAHCLPPLLLRGPC